MTLRNQWDKEKEKLGIIFYLIIIPFSVLVFNFTWLNKRIYGSKCPFIITQLASDLDCVSRRCFQEALETSSRFFFPLIPRLCSPALLLKFWYALWTQLWGLFVCFQRCLICMARVMSISQLHDITNRRI